MQVLASAQQSSAHPLDSDRLKYDTKYFYETLIQEICRSKFFDGRDVNEDIHFFISESSDDYYDTLTSHDKRQWIEDTGAQGDYELRSAIRQEVESAVYFHMGSLGGAAHLQDLQDAKEDYFLAKRRIHSFDVDADRANALFERIEGYHAYRDSEPLYKELDLPLPRDWLLAYEQSELMQTAAAAQTQSTQRI